MSITYHAIKLNTWHEIGLYIIMKIVHVNLNQPVKSVRNTIFDLLTKKAITLKAIHNRLMGNNQDKSAHFPGFTA
jgi:hypothetical protein